MSSLVHVADMAHSRSFPTNGETLSVREAVSQFLAIPTDQLESAIEGSELRLVNYGLVNDQLDRELVANDVITIHSAAVAKGGVPGAVVGNAR